MCAAALAKHPVVLLVDPDAATAEAFRKAADGIALTIEFAQTSHLAWHFLARQVPAAVFADLRLDAADGLTLLEQVGKRYPGLMRVLYTADEAPSRGVDIPVLGKPCEPEALRDLLAAVAEIARGEANERA